MRSRPRRFAIYEEDLAFPWRWSHRVRPRAECTTRGPIPTQCDVLAPEVVVWLKENASARDAWRYVIVPITTWVQRFRSDGTGQPRMINIKTADIAHEVWFARPNDALAFRMRWG